MFQRFMDIFTVSVQEQVYESRQKTKKSHALIPSCGSATKIYFEP